MVVYGGRSTVYFLKKKNNKYFRKILNELFDCYKGLKCIK